MAEEIIACAIREGYVIEATRRDSVTAEYDTSVSRFHELDLEKRESVEQFLSEIRNNKYQRVICLIGKTYSSFSNRIDLDDIHKYFDMYCARLFYLINQICDNNLLDYDLSQCTVLSSRAGKFASYDPFYSAAKGATTSFVRSLSKKLGHNKNVVSLSPGLIIGSKMEREMTRENIESHLSRSNNLLLDVKEASSQIWQKSLIEKCQVGTETDYMLGPEYK